MTTGMINRINLPENGYLCIPDANKMKGKGLISRDSNLMFFFHITVLPIRNKRAQWIPCKCDPDKPRRNLKTSKKDVVNHLMSVIDLGGKGMNPDFQKSKRTISCAM